MRNPSASTPLPVTVTPRCPNEKALRCPNEDALRCPDENALRCPMQGSPTTDPSVVSQGSSLRKEWTTDRPPPLPVAVCPRSPCAPRSPCRKPESRRCRRSCGQRKRWLRRREVGGMVAATRLPNGVPSCKCVALQVPSRTECPASRVSAAVEGNPHRRISQASARRLAGKGRAPRLKPSESLGKPSDLPCDSAVPGFLLRLLWKEM